MKTDFRITRLTDGMTKDRDLWQYEVLSFASQEFGVHPFSDPSFTHVLCQPFPFPLAPQSTKLYFFLLSLHSPMFVSSLLILLFMRPLLPCIPLRAPYGFCLIHSSILGLQPSSNFPPKDSLLTCALWAHLVTLSPLSMSCSSYFFLQPIFSYKM